MTASDRREAIIDAAKDDARQAVDLLLDAIGRILLAHLDAHETTTPPPTAAGSRWTPHEEELLRQHYPTGGPAAVQKAGVHRNAASITSRAYATGLTTRQTNGHAWTPDEDAILTQAYPHGRIADTVNALTAAGYHRTLDAVRFRATRLQLKRVRVDAPSHSTLQRILTDVITADEADMPLDSTNLTPHDQGALRRLRQDNLVKYLGDNLWAPTLKGIAQQRNAA